MPSKRHRVGVISFTTSKVVDDADIEVKIGDEVNRHLFEELRQIHETYDSCLRALEERLHPAISAHVRISSICASISSTFTIMVQV